MDASAETGSVQILLDERSECDSRSISTHDTPNTPTAAVSTVPNIMREDFDILSFIRVDLF